MGIMLGQEKKRRIRLGHAQTVIHIGKLDKKRSRKQVEYGSQVCWKWPGDRVCRFAIMELIIKTMNVDEITQEGLRVRRVNDKKSPEGEK